ncbi:HtaA domain-containing protein [Micrococcoides hystricis]|uniref:HtaA domain-containing protein n=1 Tax=Micrococcoides hystricis TaxID=1572761 RepID=A0ABV6PAM1_9MICC
MTLALQGTTRSRAKKLALSMALTAGLLAPISLPFATADTQLPPSATQECRDAVISESTMDWGFRESFMKYLTGRIANGKVETTSPVTETNHVFSFTGGSGEYSFATHDVSISYPGSFSFWGHGGTLDSTFSNVRIVIEGGKKAFFVADVKYQGDLNMATYESTTYNEKDVKFATIDTSAMTVDRATSTLSFTNAATNLTADGVRTMAEFYPENEPLAPITLTAKVGALGSACPPAPVETEAPAEPEPTQPATPKPSTPNPSTQSPKPTKPATSKPDSAKSAEAGVSAGTFDWGVKKSFMSYINGPIAKGKVTVNGGKNNAGTLSFAKANGVFDPTTKKGHVTFPGSVNFTGHNGALNTTFTNFSVHFDGSKTAVLRADVNAKELSGGTYSGKQVALATVDAASLKVSKSSLSLKNAAAKLTKDGAEAFGGFYEAENALDPVSITASYSQSTKPVAADKTKAPTSTGSPAKTGSSRTGNAKTPAGVAATAGGTGATNSGSTATTATGGGSATATDMVEVCADHELVNGTASWGVKSSFAAYLRGAIANGDWDLTGVTHSNGAFNFSNGTGTFDKTAGTGVLSLPGTLHFKGHSGALDMKMTNLKIKINGANSATMIWDVSSKGYEGQGGVDATGVEFASISGPISVTDDKISVSGAEVKLTKTGADAFAGFYQAGQVMDPISFSASIGEGGSCSMVPADSAAAASAGKGGLAKTGASATPLAATGFGALLLGVAAFFAARRNKTEAGGQ